MYTLVPSFINMLQQSDNPIIGYRVSDEARIKIFFKNGAVHTAFVLQNNNPDEYYRKKYMYVKYNDTIYECNRDYNTCRYLCSTYA